ncbi:MAG: single-stranded DNA-binding protein, partial [Spirochaetaceae bacterium]|nr:single-stranded DNA-binding protein [Spirochaetaceae bacterium]
GELRQDRWQQDGQNRSKVVISAITVQLLGGGPGQGGAPGGSAYGGSYSGGAGGGYSGGAGMGRSYGESGDMDAGERNIPSDHQFTDDIPF